MSDDLRSPLVRKFESFATDLAVGRHDDPHVAFVVLVYPDREPAIIPVTPACSPQNINLISSDRNENGRKPAGRFFTYQELKDAAMAMGDATSAMRMFRYPTFRKSAVLGQHVGQEIRHLWDRRKAFPMVEALAKAADLAAHPAACDCGQRFKTDRGLAMHRARSRTHRAKAADAAR